MTTLYAPVALIWARVQARTVRTENGCWEWQGAVTSRGYGCISVGKRGKTETTHRIAVLARDGAIPDDLTVDHLCRNKRCVNPDHLEVVTGAENSRRDREARGYHLGGQCGSGHVLTPTTTARSKRGRLVCLACEDGYRHAHLMKTSHPYRVRQWAQHMGIEVGARGRIPRAVLDAYESAHRQVAA